MISTQSIAAAFINYVINMTNLSSSPDLLLYHLGQIVGPSESWFLSHPSNDMIIVPISLGSCKD